MTPSTALAINPEAEQVQTEALSTLETAKALTIADNDGYLKAAEYRKAIRALDQKAEEFFRPLKQKQDEAKKALLDAEKAVRIPLQQALEATDGKLKTWEREQERLRQEEEKRLQEIARKQAEDEAVALAAELEAQGDTETAEAIISAPVEAPAVIVESFVPKVTGIGRRETWRYRITNEKLIPREYLMLDHSKVGGVVRSMKASTRIAGIEAYDADKQ